MRAALASYRADTPVEQAYVLYYAGWADLMSGDRPVVPRLQAIVDGLESERRARFGLMPVLLIAGMAYQAGQDWRRPLLTFRAEMNLRFSIWRAIWPVRRFAIGGMVVWSIWWRAML